MMTFFVTFACKCSFLVIIIFIIIIRGGWMDERVLGHFFALSRLNWAGDNLD